MKVESAIRNIHRTVGAMLSGEVARRYGHAGLPEDTISIKFKGIAGQSFGAFLARGVSVRAGARYRLRSPPAIRVTTARLPIDRAGPLAGDLQQILLGNPATRGP